MDLYHLECFYMVAEGKSFLQVAEEMNTSQSTISRMIRTLEEEMGVALLDRSGRSAALTPAGRTMMLELKELLPQIHKMRDHVRSYAGNKNLSYALVPYTPFLYVKGIVDSFCEIHPNCKITRREVATVPDAIELLKNYQIDYLIYHKVLENEWQDLICSEEIHDDRLMIVLPSNHPLAKLESIPYTAISDEMLLIDKLSYFDIMQISEAYHLRFRAHFENLSRVDLLMKVLEDGKLGTIWESETKLFQFTSLVIRPLQIDPIPYVIATRKNGMSDIQASFYRYFMMEKARLDRY